MAYLDVREVAEAASYATVAVEPVGFTRREWQVIVLAQRDGLSSLRESPRLSLISSCFDGNFFTLNPHATTASPPHSLKRTL